MPGSKLTTILKNILCLFLQEFISLEVTSYGLVHKKLFHFQALLNETKSGEQECLFNINPGHDINLLAFAQ